MKDNFSQWSIAHRIGFRFLFSYFLYYTLFDYVTYSIPYGHLLSGITSSFWEFLVPPVGEHILGIEGEIYMGPNGSGDSTSDYVALFIKFALAIVTTVVWTVLDKRRLRYERIRSVFIIYLRYFLAGVMISYGFAKVFPLQFSEPSLHGLVKSYGDFSPMGVLWRFMGSSVSYTIFSGAAEVFAGLLLFHRKTLRLGAFLSFGVMANVVMLNFSYDVPVKLFSLHLLLMSMVLMGSDLKRYMNFFIFNKPVTATEITSYFSSVSLNRAGLVTKILFIGILLFANISGRYESYSSIEKRKAQVLYGIHKVNHFGVMSTSDSIGYKNDVAVPDSIRWDQLVIHYPTATRIYYKDNTNDLMKYKVDTLEKTLNIWSYDSTRVFSFDYYQKSQETLLLKGIGGQDSLEIRMHLFPKDSFLLYKRGFNWISEFPFNR